jgi:hypothetical protein
VKFDIGNFYERVLSTVYRSLNAIMAQLKTAPFGLKTTVELKTIKTTNNKVK